MDVARPFPASLAPWAACARRSTQGLVGRTITAARGRRAEGFRVQSARIRCRARHPEALEVIAPPFTHFLAAPLTALTVAVGTAMKNQGMLWLCSPRLRDDFPKAVAHTLGAVGIGPTPTGAHGADPPNAVSLRDAVSWLTSSRIAVIKEGDSE